VRQDIGCFKIVSTLQASVGEIIDGVKVVEGDRAIDRLRGRAKTGPYLLLKT
jgi:hypothetical protein